MDKYNFFADRSIERHNKSDVLFFISVILLFGLGLFTQIFCTQSYAVRMFHDPYHFVKRQLLSMVAGVVGFLLFSSLKISVIRKIIPFLLGITLFLCILSFVPGVSVKKNGAPRWIRMPLGFTLQPSEIVKFILVLFLANLFDKQLRLDKEERNVFPCVFVLMSFIMLVLGQKDLSTSLFIFCVCFLMFAACGMNIKWAFALGVLAVPALFLFIASEPYRIERVIAFLHPDRGAQTFNYQSIAAKRAISSGGLWGAGIGTGLVQTARVPEVQTDYIFAGWTEAMGLGGVMAYFVLLIFFALRGYKIALFCKNRFAAIATFGFVSMIVCQSMLNCAVVCGALPSTGIPLPFFSVGGSSMIVTLCMCGFVINASRYDSEDNSNSENNFVQIEDLGGITV